MPRSAYGAGVIFVPVDELGGIIRELYLRGKKNLNFEYNQSLGGFVFYNVDNNSVVRDVHEILREAKLICDPDHFDPVAGKL